MKISRPLGGGITCLVAKEDTHLSLSFMVPASSAEHTVNVEAREGKRFNGLGKCPGIVGIPIISSVQRIWVVRKVWI